MGIFGDPLANRAAEVRANIELVGRLGASLALRALLISAMLCYVGKGTFAGALMARKK